MAFLPAGRGGSSCFFGCSRRFSAGCDSARDVAVDAVAIVVALDFGLVFVSSGCCSSVPSWDDTSLSRISRWSSQMTRGRVRGAIHPRTADGDGLPVLAPAAAAAAAVSCWCWGFRVNEVGGASGPRKGPRSSVTMVSALFSCVVCCLSRALS